MVVDECRDREVDVGVEDGCDEADETKRRWLNCGWRSGRNFIKDAGTVEGASVFRRREGAEFTILPLVADVSRGRIEAIVRFSEQMK